MRTCKTSVAWEILFKWQTHVAQTKWQKRMTCVLVFLLCQLVADMLTRTDFCEVFFLPLSLIRTNLTMDTFSNIILTHFRDHSGLRQKKKKHLKKAPFQGGKRHIFSKKKKHPFHKQKALLEQKKTLIKHYLLTKSNKKHFEKKNGFVIFILTTVHHFKFL